ncbi:MAG: hypothetical protein ABSG40_18130, partial [Terriglobales bacterium]
LGNPAKYAGFPLFHRLGYGRLTKPDISLATKTGHFNLLTTACALVAVGAEDVAANDYDRRST